MKKTTLLAFLFSILFFVGASSQVSVVLFPSPAKQFFIDDIWKTLIINPATQGTNTTIQFQIRNNSSSDVLTVTTGLVMLTTGANRLAPSISTGSRWVYGNTEASGILQSTGKLPYGDYTFCVSVFDAMTNKLLASDCDEREVAPMLPPELINPLDKDTVIVKYPLLTWIPPRPVIGINVVYSLVLSSIEENQAPAAALQQNTPLLRLDNLNNTYLTYPATAPELEPGKQYVWQVAASYEGYNLGETDIWTFTVKPPPPVPQEAIIYPFASKVSDGHFYVTRGIFRFAYDNKASDKKLIYTIRRTDKNESLSSLPEMNIKPGTNKIEVDLTHNPGLSMNKYYDLEITDSKGQVYKLLFFYIKS